MAEILSRELFSEFLWETSGPWNQNWPCEETERHAVKTHPSDVVFWYDNPYSLTRTYVNCDLKSYSRGSITTGRITSAIESLARSLNCAEKSQQWQKLYVHEHVTPDISGLLFIYNHDGEFDRDFGGCLSEVTPNLAELPKRSKIVVLGPSDIFWLSNVRYEIVQMRGKGELPQGQFCQYYYPNLVLSNNLQPANARSATLEILTSPWIILSYPASPQTDARNFIIFYRRRGEEVREFLYLIDYLMHYQTFDNNTIVKIKTLEPGLLAPPTFGKAIDEYLDVCEKSGEIKRRLDQIQYSQMGQIQTRFSPIEIGMDSA